MSNSRRISSFSGPTVSAPDDMAMTEVTEVHTGASSADAVESPISDAEALQLREEKLAAIRKAIAAGAYDSDEILEKALGKMLESFSDE